MSSGHYLFGFNGRLNRAKVWLWILIVIGVEIVGAIIAAALYYFGNAAVADVIWGVLYVLYVCLTVGVFISWLAVLTKRLHDRNKSAWWLVVFLLLPQVLNAIAVGAAITDIVNVISSGGDLTEIPELSPLAKVLLLISLAISLWMFVELYCLRGTVGPNQYGPDPLEGKA